LTDQVKLQLVQVWQPAQALVANDQVDLAVVRVPVVDCLKACQMKRVQGYVSVLPLVRVLLADKVEVLLSRQVAKHQPEGLPLSV
jgi:hypothetical protein